MTFSLVFIKLKGIRSFYNAVEINFNCPTGLTVLQSSTGMGKTTIIEAILFALTGQIPTGTKSKLDGGVFASFLSGNNEEEDAHIILALESGGERQNAIEIAWIFPAGSKNSPKCTLKVNGIIVHSNLAKKPAEKAIAELLGVPGSFLRLLLFDPQPQDGKAWAYSTPNILKEFMDELLNLHLQNEELEQLSTAKKCAKQERSKLQDRVDNITSPKDADIQGTENNLEKAKIQKTYWRQEEEKTQNELAQICSNINQYKGWIKCELDIASIIKAGKLSMYTDDELTQFNAEDANRKIDSLGDEIKDHQNKINALSIEKVENSNEKDNLFKLFGQVESTEKISRVWKIYKSAETDYHTAKYEMGVLKGKMMAFESVLKDLGDYSTCADIFALQDKKLQKLSNEMNEKLQDFNDKELLYNGSAEILEEAINSERIAVSELERNGVSPRKIPKLENSNIKRKLELAEDKIKELDVQISSEKQSKTRLLDNRKILQDKVTANSCIQKLQLARKAFAKQKVCIENNGLQLFDNSKRVAQHLEELQKKFAEENYKHTRATTELALQELKITDSQNKLKEMQALRLTLCQLQTDLIVASNGYENILQKANRRRAEILAIHRTQVQEMNAIFRTQWEELYSGRDDVETISLISEMNLETENRIEYDYYFAMNVPNSGLLKMRGRSSTGEKQLAFHIIRDALRQHFCPDIRIITFDEPMANLDSQINEYMRDKIALLANSMQVVVTTVDENLVTSLKSKVGEQHFELHTLIKDSGCSSIVEVD